MRTKIQILNPGLRPYAEILKLQQDLQQRIISGEPAETIIFCEHPPVITLGTSAAAENILVPQSELTERGVSIFSTERGGDVTYHGPGQLVCYPLLDLRKRRRDIGWYMRNLEQAIIETLSAFDIRGSRISGKTGVWTQVPENAIDSQVSAAKIASLGVRISRWCTLHGLAINISSQKAGFSLINPCGFRGVEMTSVEEERQKLGYSDFHAAAAMAQARLQLEKSLLNIFSEVSTGVSHETSSE